MSVFEEDFDPALMDFKQSLEFDLGYEAEQSGHTREMDNSGHRTIYTLDSMDFFDMDEELHDFSDDVSLDCDDLVNMEEDDEIREELENEPFFPDPNPKPTNNFSDWTTALKGTSLGFLKKTVGNLSASFSFDDSLRSLQSTSCSETEESDYESAHESLPDRESRSSTPQPFNLSFASLQQPIAEAARRWNASVQKEDDEGFQDSLPQMPQRSWNDASVHERRTVPFDDSSKEPLRDSLTRQFSELFTEFPRSLFPVRESEEVLTEPPSVPYEATNLYDYRSQEEDFVAPPGAPPQFAPKPADLMLPLTMKDEDSSSYHPRVGSNELFVDPYDMFNPLNTISTPLAVMKNEFEYEVEPRQVDTMDVNRVDDVPSRPGLGRVRKKNQSSRKKAKSSSSDSKGTPPKSPVDKRIGRDRRKDPVVKTYVHATDQDVLFGRGGLTNHHIGNKQYRAVILELQPRYKLLNTSEKTAMSTKVVRDVIDSGGRFLKQDEEGYFVVTEKAARQKVAQALREDHTPEGRAAKRSRTTAKSQKKKGNSKQKRIKAPPRKVNG